MVVVLSLADDVEFCPSKVFHTPVRPHETNLLLSEITVWRPDSLNCENVHCQDRQCQEERDSYLLDLLSAAIETCHATIPISGSKTPSSTPVIVVPYKSLCLV